MTHSHRINREAFLAEMRRRGWQLDGSGWIIPMGRRVAQQEADWYEAIVAAIECQCCPLEPLTRGLAVKASELVDGMRQRVGRDPDIADFHSAFDVVVTHVMGGAK